MAHSAGTRLGPYEIQSAIGAGGMGEVYCAKDTKLNRAVALKILPEAFTHDADRVSRFRREAQVLASLNHPHIAQIYGLDEQPGRDGQVALSFIVMELIEGEDLAQRIERGAIPIDEALPIARQIVDALEAAHDQGIVHRDLKPANIKLRGDGTVKVLDFGLAKAMEQSGGGVSGERAGGFATMSPTITTPAMTQAGMILGTAAYMSPEQAVGKALDRRSDIFSFGCLLYEMLTGRRAFQGETPGEVLADVVKTDPDWTLLPTSTPEHVGRLVRRCLVKDRRQRLQAIGEARIALESGAVAPDKAAGEPSPRASVRAWVVAAASTLAAAGLAFVHFSETPPELPVLYASLPVPDGARYTFLPALSPDGTKVAFTAATGELAARKVMLYVRTLGSPTAQPLAGTEGAAGPFWSFDGNSIAFAADGKLKRIDVTGGGLVTLTDLPSALRGGAWNADGVLLFGLNSRSALLRVAAGGGKAEPVGELAADEFNHRFPVFLEDGQRYLYQVTRGEGDTRNKLMMGALNSSGTAPQHVGEVGSNVIAANGYILSVQEGTLVAQAFDSSRGTLLGEPKPLAENIASYTRPTVAAAFSVSRTGVLVFEAGLARARRELAWYDPSGKRLGPLGESALDLGEVRLSPDGHSAVATLFANASTDLWAVDTLSGLRTRLSFDLFQDDSPVWSSDGKFVYRRGRNSKTILRNGFDGSATDQRVFESDAGIVLPESVSPDGKWLFFSMRDDTQLDIHRLPLDPNGLAAGKPVPFLATPFDEQSPTISADGAWVAYVSNESGRNEVYVNPSSGSGGKQRISTKGGTNPRWGPGGRELFYVRDGLNATEISLRNGSLAVGKTRQLFGTTPFSDYDVSRDGRFLLVENTAADAAPPALTLVQNWMGLLRK